MEVVVVLLLLLECLDLEIVGLGEGERLFKGVEGLEQKTK